ncbi:MAG: lysylphosphatidylglycerol synthase transmembrane domain-containing protein [Planctomycetota bacterium]
MPEVSAPPRPHRRASGWLSLLVRVGVTVGLMAWAMFGGGGGKQAEGGTPAQGDDWGRFIELLSQADWPWWLGALVVTLAGQVVAGIRWAALARPLGFNFPNRFFVRRFFEGMFFSLCLPSSIGGDVVKAVRIGSSTPLRLLAGCSVLADRLTGLSALGVLVGTAVISRNHQLGIPAACAVFVGLLLAVLAGFWLALAVLDRVHAALPEGSARDFVARLVPYRQRPSLVLLAVGWSFMVQLAGVASVVLVARALGVVQPALVWLSVVPLVALAMVLPISIGGFGVRETALEYLLRGYGVSSEAGVAIGLLWGMCTLIAGLVGGVLFLLERQPVVAAAPSDSEAG